MSEPPCTRIVLQREGGHLPTLRPAVGVDVSALPAAEQARLAALLAAIPPHAGEGRPRAVPDGYTWRVTLWNGTAPGRTLAFADGDGHPEELDALAAWIRKR